MKTFIVKVQRSLASSDDVQRALIYNENRDIWWEESDPKTVAEINKMLGDDLKGYFKARLHKTKIQILERTKPQDW